MLLAILACAATGLILGTRCRLMALVAVSALVAASVVVLVLASGSDLLPGLIRLVGLLAVMQACYLIGALLRVVGRANRVETTSVSSEQCGRDGALSH